jgi:hypothetical protein
MNMASCLEWGSESSQECTQTSEQSTRECTEWQTQSCDWWDLLCNVGALVCLTYAMITSTVCTVWSVVTTAVCLVWDSVTTVLNGILVTIESVVGWFLSLVAVIVEIVTFIPVLGTLIRWILSVVGFLVWSVASLIDTIGGLVGIRPEKILRVCSVILRDEKGNPVAAVKDVVQRLQLACDVYKRDANIRIVPSRPFRYATGFLGAETVTSDWVVAAVSPSDPDTLDPMCDPGGEWWLGGAKYQWIMSSYCFYGAWRRILGYGAPVTIFVVRDVERDAGAFDSTDGCALWITNYVTIQAGISPLIGAPVLRVAAHELGHSCNLWHLCVDDDVKNLMASQSACNPASPTIPDVNDPYLYDWQVLLVRASKHVTYF